MSTTSARIQERAYELIREGSVRLDRDIAKEEKRVEDLRARRDVLLLIKEKGLSDLSAEESAELSNALMIYSKGGLS